MWKLFSERPKKQKLALSLFLALMLTLTMLLGIFWQWSQTHNAISESAQTALTKNEATVSFSTTHNNQWLVFLPKENKKTQGVILYPGALVSPYAYAGIATDLAAAGYPVVIPKMPFNLALANAGVYQDIIAQFPTVQSWALGGHSLGGAFAALQVDPSTASVPSTIDGLFFLGAYPTADFSQTTLPMLNIWASEDLLVDEATRIAAEPNFSSQTTQIWLEGGNHAQFGLYGEQAGDGQATITVETQQQLIVEAFLTWLPTLNQ
ncbi:MAG: alpha/beta hydrolase [Culicoidibacterales bacterium]